RMDASGGYSNGSGCGNEVATNNTMVRKYVIESLKHWMKDYHINGFRFDLMGLHETETMQEIYKELSAIDKNVMVYGEPWTGNGSYPADGCKGAVAVSGAAGGNGVGAFDDDFRDAIKGAEYGGFQKGQVQGTNKDSGITAGLVGTSGSNKRNETGKPGLALHYVECHDNYTLFDKLAISYLNRTSGSGDLFTQIKAAGLAEVKKQDMLAAAYVFLSQGTPFINGGQEFLRTKKGDENSYQSDDSINQINLGFKTTYSDVYDTYKGLIALRKANPSAFGANTSAKAETVSTGVTKYTTDNFLVYFNATDAAADIATAGYTKAVDVSSGAPVDAAVPTSVPAKSFVILKK
ncbi:MAG: alpha-amylase, partial [Treponemataceae bacterium]|nr:alpha-amylase [Treponemataceae bacterium]